MFEDRHLKLHIQKSKAEQYRQGSEVVIAELGGATCSMEMLNKYVELGGVKLSSESALFHCLSRTTGGAKLRAIGGISYNESESRSRRLCARLV